jgi:hypothetical protein
VLPTGDRSMSEPNLRVLPLGAGVQSTTLTLMACDGALPGLNAAIFTDTGWEPKSPRLCAHFALARRNISPCDDHERTSQ